MTYIALVAVVFVMRIAMKLNLVSTCMAGLTLILLFRKYEQLVGMQKREENRFEEVCEYLDQLLYSFLREGKIIRAMENVSRTLGEGSMKETLVTALYQMEMVTDKRGMYRHALEAIEQEYDCSRIKNAHDFILHVENYGGDIEQPIKLLIKDKNWWQKRIRFAMNERKQYFREVVMSIVASLIICGAILYLPIQNVDVSKSVLSQMAALLVLILNSFIFLKAQKNLSIDWLKVDLEEEENSVNEKLYRFRNYDEQKEKIQSVILAVPAILLSGYFLLRGKEGYSCVCLCLSLIFGNQHILGRRIAYKNLMNHIRRTFPKWLLDLVLVLQSENVYVSLVKTCECAPLLIKEELKCLIAQLEMDPESAKPYHHFFEEFAIPEVHSSMGMLFALSQGNCGNAKQQLNELIDRNLEMMNLVDEERLKEKNGRMYGLFLAPVLVAAIKLLVDMAIFLIVFLKSNLG